MKTKNKLPGKKVTTVAKFKRGANHAAISVSLSDPTDGLPLTTTHFK